MVPLTLFATASHAALERSSSGRMSIGVANTNAAILTTPAQEGRALEVGRCALTRQRGGHELVRSSANERRRLFIHDCQSGHGSSSPTLRLHVVRMNVATLRRRSYHFAHVLTVFDHRRAIGELDERDLMAAIGMSSFTPTVKLELSSVTTPSALVPALRPSTTTTATLSFGL